MPYSRTWDETQPLGSAAASTIDDIMRADKADIRERMDSLVVDWTADPVVLNPDNIGTAAKILVIPPSALNPAVDSDAVTYSTTYTQGVGNNAKFMIAPVLLPPGVTITGFQMLADDTGVTDLKADLFKTEFDAGAAVTVVSTLTSTSDGLVITDSGVLAEAIASTHFYSIKAYCVMGFAVGNPRFYGFRISYTTPDSRYTI